MSPTRATLTDVARAAGVSVATASRALSGTGQVSAATRMRVQRAARDAGYTRAGDGRGRPRAGSGGLIDLVLSGFDASWAEEAISGAVAEAVSRGYDLVLTTERDEPDEDWPMRIRARGSAGVVLGLIAPTRTQVAALRDAGIPIVLLDPRGESRLPAASVRTTDRQGGGDAAAHLVERGAERFVVIGGVPAYRFGRARVGGFLDRLRHLRPDAPVEQVSSGWSMAAAGAGVRGPLRSAREAGARVGVFACSDEMASGVYAAAAALGMTIPRDVMVVGFDDVREARWLAPPLTTVRQPIRAMAAAAVALLDSIEGRLDAADDVVLPTSLVVRASTGR
ncbi:LacI family DNA-binding transcriptional regulator [Microbacterium sp. NPDC078428]|uniref:LacI family DNA-binding transcriptional regulator n=1 Tax=Microbacterium sp. NPDC078428 TaxID=3364190 RepID=UPI0037CB4B4D